MGVFDSLKYKLLVLAMLPLAAFAQFVNVEWLAGDTIVPYYTESFDAGYDYKDKAYEFVLEYVETQLATKEEIETIKKYAFGVNEQLKAFWAECGVTLVDFKLEFGKLSDGTIVLADEISPDTCRLWDSKTGEKLDKDRFRRNLGGVEDAYAEVMKRLSEHI